MADEVLAVLCFISGMLLGALGLLAVAEPHITITTKMRRSLQTCQGEPVVVGKNTVRCDGVIVTFEEQAEK